MKKIIIGIVFILATFIAMLAVFFTAPWNNTAPEIINIPTNIATQPTEAAVPAANTDNNPNELSLLRSQIEENINAQPGTWSVYIKNLKTGNDFDINNQKMKSASLIKLFILGAVSRQIEDNKIALEEVDNYMRKMITISDNESSNILVSKLANGKYTDMYAADFQAGLNMVNQFAAAIGCTGTEQQRDLKDSRPKPIPEENYTSVRDCGKVLSMIYNNEFVSQARSQYALELLKNQQRRHKIPAALPKTVITANKTGELSDVENDAAIVYSGACDYIICVMSSDLPSVVEAQKNIQKISKLTYDFFNPAG